MTQVLDGRGSAATRAIAAMLVAMAMSLVAASGAWAAETAFSTMKVSVWPEYDDPRVLVIYEGDLDPSVRLPVEITFNLPKGAEIGMACEVDPSGGHSCKPFRTEDKGDYQSLTYQVDTQRKVFFEYYYDAFPAGEALRTFDVSIMPALAVADLTLAVQQPARSTGFSLTPSFPQQLRDSQGLTYHQQRIGEAVAGEPIEFTVSYSKPDSEPSVTSQPQSAGGTSAVGGEGGGSDPLLPVVAVVGVTAVGLLGYRALKPASATRNGGRPRADAPGRLGGRRQVTPSAGGGRDAGGPRASSRRGARAEAAGARAGGARAAAGSRAEEGSSAKFCTDCGSRLRVSDRFCSGCGHEQGS